MPVRRRRRKRRHALNPLRYLTPEVLANITKIVAGGAVVATPAMMVNQHSGQQIEAAETKLGYANSNTNAALAGMTALSMQVDSLRREVAELKYRQRIKSPERAFGPDVPAGWVAQPVKKRARWRFWERG